ncbi:hypothetical protein CSC70_10380 [Pseudoxanthomonas kalamensis DSM 18571]|uniref:hypothetical protein n=1 Tax=Pseudoxanthomonas kalamensis TaxID=289483 RepID=UPI001390F1F6|nr:hypothetical protein CSC70_10380 [Pseudoxanthomonas kalamensis DSM 18571]
MTLREYVCGFVVAWALCACAGSSLVTVPVEPSVSPQQRLVAVREAGGGEDTELQVQPLRDPQVEDLRLAAERALAAGDIETAVNALNQALLIVGDDPAVLQERAEVALLQADYERVERLARRAFDLGSRVGPLCRRHWAAIEQARLARGEDLNAASAHAQIQACTVAGVTRM